ncbi:MAG: hypothetical protein FJ303_14160 [Planctomycetes bacterium]|nr:hypothetical protein [Planctomycetota bacterium]
MDQQLGDLLAQVEEKFGPQFASEEDEGYRAEAVQEEGLSAADEKRIEELFEKSKQDRSKTFELKQELDRLNVFKDYEDRFLDLFKKAE